MKIKATILRYELRKTLSQNSQSKQIKSLSENRNKGQAQWYPNLITAFKRQRHTYLCELKASSFQASLNHITDTLSKEVQTATKQPTIKESTFHQTQQLKSIIKTLRSGAGRQKIQSQFWLQNKIGVTSPPLLQCQGWGEEKGMERDEVELVWDMAAWTCLSLKQKAQD